jgi:hypothetical protein
MKRAFSAFRFPLMLVVTLTTTLAGSACSKEPPIEHKWVFFRRPLQVDSDVDDFRRVADEAAASGYNGVALECSFDWILDLPPEYFDRLRRIKAICDERGLEIIPLVCALGSDGVLYQDKNLAAAVPVTGAPFRVKDGVASAVTREHVANGDLEEYSDNVPSGFSYADGSGNLSFVDKKVYRSGRASMRFENFDRDPHGMARLNQLIQVEPFRTYRLECWLKTEGLRCPSSVIIHAHAHAKGQRILMTTYTNMDSTSEWRRAVMGFNSLDYDTVQVYIGVWGATGGRFWIDDVSITESGPANIVRREGTPLTVRGASGTVYTEGADYESVVDTIMDFTYDHPDPAIRLTPESKIAEGEPLIVDYYQALRMDWGVGVCPTNPKLYEIWKGVLARVHKELAPKSYFLSVSEVRTGGWCETCRDLGGAERLGRCITRQAELVRAMAPDAALYIWSDMLDPHVNAVPRHFLYNGDLTGSWKYIPKDLTIVCWGLKATPESMKHFDRLGFRTMAACYYDADSLDAVAAWLEALRGVSGSRGIMYTTWENKYRLLTDFGRLVQR